MTQFLRGKQVGIKNDLSAGLDPDSFAIDLVRLPLPAESFLVAWLT